VPRRGPEAGGLIKNNGFMGNCRKIDLTLFIIAAIVPSLPALEYPRNSKAIHKVDEGILRGIEGLVRGIIVIASSEYKKKGYRQESPTQIKCYFSVPAPPGYFHNREDRSLPVREYP